jgi:hypothetical protein
MADGKIKVVSTKLAKQVSGYALLGYDMQFASRVFGLAAKCEVRTQEEIHDNRPSLDTRFRELVAMDPFLRAGATVAQIDADGRNESEAVRSALFEAGIVTYGRCFNSGLRTHLSEGIFRGHLSPAKKLHEALMKIRNKHIAHSELKMERSLVGCALVEDQNYGRRPSLVMTVLALRRKVPTNERLLELKGHCDAIVAHVIHPRFLEKSRALREQLLQMPSEQIEDFVDFGAEVPVIDEFFQNTNVQ